MLPYQKRYDLKVSKVQIKLNPDVDQDIIDFLNTCDNKQALIKKLLREEIKKRGSLN